LDSKCRKHTKHALEIGWEVEVGGPVPTGNSSQFERSRLFTGRGINNETKEASRAFSVHSKKTYIHH
jgi:hypothetical protein